MEIEIIKTENYKLILPKLAEKLHEKYNKITVTIKSSDSDNSNSLLWNSPKHSF